MLKQKIKRIEKQIELSANRRKRWLEAIKEYWLTGKSSYDGEIGDLNAEEIADLGNWIIKMKEEVGIENLKGYKVDLAKKTKVSENDTKDNINND